MNRWARRRFTQRLATVALLVVIASVVFQPQNASAETCAAAANRLSGTSADLSLESNVRKARPGSVIELEATVTRSATGTPGDGFEIWVTFMSKKQAFYGYAESDANGHATIDVTIPAYAKTGWYDLRGYASKTYGRVCHSSVVEEYGSTALDRFLRVL